MQELDSTQYNASDWRIWVLKMAQRLTWQNVNAGAEMEDLPIFGPGNLWRRVCLEVTQQRHHVALSHTNLLLFRARYSRRDCKKRRELHITVSQFGVFWGGLYLALSDWRASQLFRPCSPLHTNTQPCLKPGHWEAVSYNTSVILHYRTLRLDLSICWQRCTKVSDN